MPRVLRSIRLDRDLVEKIEQLAKSEGRTFSNMLERLLKLHFKNKRK